MTQERLTCSKSAIKTLEKGKKFSDLTIKTPKGHQRCPAIFILDSEHIL